MKRIVAVVMPKLACEVARYRTMTETRPRGPIAVILDRDDGRSEATATLDVVEDEARKYGVRAGQRAAEAAALLSSLAIHRIPFDEVEDELGRVAEMALAFAPTAATHLSTDEIKTAASIDTVWLDATGAAHLVGGEDALIDELGERAAALGHEARVAIANGPRIAQALARWGEPGRRRVEDFASLPVQALPMEAEIASWFVRLGVFTIADLARLPRAQVRARLGARAAEIVDLLEGRDDVPLLPYVPPRALEEELGFDEPVASGESLLFVLRAMTSRLAARLAARGEACGRLEIAIAIDRSIAKLRRGPSSNDDEDEDDEAAPAIALAVDLPAPLADAGDLLRAIKPQIDRLDLPAPAVGVRVVIPQIARAARVQLDLSRDRAASPDNLPALLAELSGDIGKEWVGVLDTPNELLPENRSSIVPWELGAKSIGQLGSDHEEPTRILNEPVKIAGVHKDSVIAVDGKVWVVDRTRFLMRFDDVAWWTPRAASRDYARVWLSASIARGRSPSSGGGEKLAASAFVYVDRATGDAFLQGWFE